MNPIGLIYITMLFLLLGEISFPQIQDLKVYGFFDFEAEANNKDASGNRWTFDQHHLNLLSNYQLSNQFQVMTEVEWEHGPMHSSGESIGNIYLAKAFLEYKYSDALLIRIGKFMSPFGIYNERHDATPTFLFTFLPKSVYGEKELSFGGAGRLFAKHSTGIQLLGNWFNRNWSIKYQVYLSNGRGPKESEQDNNFNKGVGFRFVVSPPIADLHLGTSYYSDKNGNANNARQTTIGFDLEYDLSDAHLEAEYIIPKLETVDTNNALTGNFRYVNGFYLMGAYTFFDDLIPFVRYEFFDPDIDVNNDDENIVVAGINFSASSKVYFKGEIHFHQFQNLTIKNYELLVFSVAVAF